MGMDQYLLIPFLVGWTSIYQLFWCSPGVQGFDTLPYYDCSFCAVYMQFICSGNVICKLQYYTYIQQKCGKSQKPHETKAKKNNKKQKPKAKSQAKPKPKAKSQMGMQIGSKLQQIARKSEILAPKCSKYKPEARNQRSQKPKARSQKPTKKKCKKKQKKYPSEI